MTNEKYLDISPSKNSMQAREKWEYTGHLQWADSVSFSFTDNLMVLTFGGLRFWKNPTDRDGNALRQRM